VVFLVKHKGILRLNSTVDRYIGAIPPNAAVNNHLIDLAQVCTSLTLLSFELQPALIVGLDMEDEVMELANRALLALSN
jgi:hypothetical protein